LAVEFRLLGNVEAHVDGQRVDLGHGRQKCVLLALLVEANRAISTDQLIDRAWGTHRPHRARDTLYSYLSRLRRALATTDDVGLVRSSGGYLLTVDETAVDLHRFHRALGQARASGDENHAASLFEQALGLWRGEPFAGLDTPWVATVRAALARERLAAELDYTDLQLRRGQHAEVLADLTTRTAQHPLDERLAGQLMLTLYRSGRQADALEHYRQVRGFLAEELGADPSPPLQQLHQQILTAHPALTRRATKSGAGTALSPVPRQLPPAAGLFTGRHRELDQLAAVLDAHADSSATVVISAVSGAGGIGKTSLALHWAHQHADRFPDGQLYVNLRGFDPSGTPMSPGVAVRGFLDALGVEPAVIPVDLDAQVGLYRSLVAGKHLLIVLDNAATTTQLTPLLPGSPTCAVIVTSRRHLTGLVTAHGARALKLDVLTESEARELLAWQLGPDRMAAEPDAVAELLAWCAGLPLALGIVAARASGHPDFPLAVLADELRDASTRLDGLDSGETNLSLRAVLSWSYHALTPEAASLFGLLGLALWPDIGLTATASLTALSIARTRVLLRELETAHLVTQHAPGRYRMHDLVHLYAAEQAHHDQPTERSEEALRRLVDFYLHTTYTGARLLDPHRPPFDLRPPAAGCQPDPLAGEAEALAWLDTEHRCLLASQQFARDRGEHTQVWQLAWALHTFHYRRGHLQDLLVAWRAGLAATEHLGDPTTQAQARLHLDDACALVGRHAEALDHLGQALSLAQDSGDLLGQAHSHLVLAGAWRRQGDDQRALDHASQVLHLIEGLDNPVWKADALNTVGALHARLGHPQARGYCEAALVLFRRHHHRQGEAATLDNLGYLAHRTGQHTHALHYYQQALILFRNLGNTYEEANTLDRLGSTHSILGQRDEARRTWQQALDLHQAQHRTTDADRIQQQLDDLDERTRAG
jgi:DNA-binding SARP family transcriptional activator/Tfp pilus assembly protein PilF